MQDTQHHSNNGVQKYNEPAASEESLVRPGVNLQFLGSLVLVALPLTLLFLIVTKGQPTP